MEGERSERRSRLISLQKDADRLEKEIGGLVRRIAGLPEGVVEKSVLPEVRRMQEECDQKQAEIVRLRSEPKVQRSTPERLSEVLGSLRQALERLSIAEQKELLRLLLNGIKVGPDQVKIGLNTVLMASIPPKEKAPQTEVFVERQDWLPRQDSNLQPSG